MIKTFIINKGQKPTEEQLQEIAEAKKYPIIFDEDCPELSPAMRKAFRIRGQDVSGKVQNIVRLAAPEGGSQSLKKGNDTTSLILR